MKLFLRVSLLFALLIQSAAAEVKMVKVVGGLSRPVDIVHAGDGSDRLFIVLQDGRIVIYDGTKVLATSFLSITSGVSCCGERGLLSAAFHPDYAGNGFFYILHTNLSGDVVVARYKVSTDPNRASGGTRRTMLTIPHRSFSNHNGGKLAFGPDGFLYISIGDGGGGGDTPNNAQNLGVLLGKVLRIDVDRGLPYTIPANNPFTNTAGAKKEIWAYGLRNPWRIGFDRKQGNLYIADVGQDRTEEVNFQKSTSTGGENYGWRRMEGKNCFNPTSNCNDGTLNLPVVTYSHSQGCSITGGPVYRGAKVPELSGTYLYADFCTGVIWGAKRVSGKWTTSVLLNTQKNISTFGEDEVGEIYFAHLSDPDGTLFRIAQR